MAKMGSPIRHRHLDRDDAGQSVPDERPWTPLREWPRGAHFEDISAAELAFERLTGGVMPPRPILVDEI